MEIPENDYEIMFQCPIYCEDKRKKCKETIQCGISIMDDRLVFTGACEHVNAPIGSTVYTRLEGEAEFLLNLCVEEETAQERREAIYGKEALPCDTGILR